MKSVCFLFCLFFFLDGKSQQLIDSRASVETKALYVNLKKLSQRGFLFGHQDDDAYGVGWNAVEGRSDVKEVCGSYPGVHGWDLGKLGRPDNLDSVNFANMHRWIQNVYQRGGVNTISWHVDNPVTRKNAWDKTPAVKDVLPGGGQHNFFVSQLDLVADFLNHCESNGVKIPIIFRPYHEHNGDWFWWGKGNCSEAEYIQLWQFTVRYLKDTRQLHHLIFAFSPDRSRMNIDDASKSYLYAYPGDEFVDILGLDNYMDVGASWNKRTPEENRAGLIKSLSTISLLATEKNKVPAMTETGMEGVTNHEWYTNIILDPIKKTPEIHIAYLMVWRNANTKHHYAPYPGHASVPDFIKFYEDPGTLFESDLKDIYKN